MAVVLCWALSGVTLKKDWSRGRERLLDGLVATVVSSGRCEGAARRGNFAPPFDRAALNLEKTLVM